MSVTILQDFPGEASHCKNKPRNKGNRNTEYMLLILSHYCYMNSSRRSLHRYGLQNSQKFSLKPGNKANVTITVLVVVYISVVLPAVSSIVSYWCAAGVAPETSSN